jgi:hypothetical protein
MEWGAAIFQWVVGVCLTTVTAGMLTIYFKVRDLHKWHNKEDEQGVKVWYQRNKSMEEILVKMTDIMDRVDRREERALLIQNETIRVMTEHTNAITKLVAVVEALTVITKRNG